MGKGITVVALGLAAVIGVAMPAQAQNVRVVHFQGADKPWKWDRSGRASTNSGLTNLWWDNYDAYRARS